MGSGLGACFLALRYSVLSFAILSLISFSLRISSSVGGISQGSGMVDLLYSSLLFRLIWVSLDMICDSGGGFGLVLDLFLCLGFLIGFGFGFMSWFVWLAPGPGSDSDSDLGWVPDSGAGPGSDSGLGPGLGSG